MPPAAPSGKGAGLSLAPGASDARAVAAGKGRASKTPVPGPTDGGSVARRGGTKRAGPTPRATKTQRIRSSTTPASAPARGSERAPPGSTGDAGTENARQPPRLRWGLRWGWSRCRWGGGARASGESRRDSRAAARERSGSIVSDEQEPTSDSGHMSGRRSTGRVTTRSNSSAASARREREAAIPAGVVPAGPLVCAVGPAVNDRFDRPMDAINEPGRPIPSRRLPPIVPPGRAVAARAGGGASPAFSAESSPTACPIQAPARPR